MKKLAAWLICLSLFFTGGCAALAEDSASAPAAIYEKMYAQMMALIPPDADERVVVRGEAAHFIWGTDVSVQLPTDAYVLSRSDSLYVWYSATLGQMVGFGVSDQFALSAWKAVMENNGYATGSDVVNGIALVYGIGAGADSCSATFYFNEGTHTYSLMGVNLTQQQALAMKDELLATLRKTPCTDYLDLPADAVTIGDDAFAATAAQEIVLPDGCTTIGSRAFANCAQLRRIIIPASVTAIGEDAFAGCPHITIIGEKGSTAETWADSQHMLFLAK